MTCPCMYPVILTIIDSDGDKVEYISMPFDELDDDRFKIPKIETTTHKGREYIAVIWEDPEGANLKSYVVNDHIVYAGCLVSDLTKKGNKTSCKEKELFLVLHPKEEWESYHIREIKA